MGYQATTAGLVDFRLAVARGGYERVGQLGSKSGADEMNAPYTLRDVVRKARAGGQSASVGISSRGLVSWNGDKPRA